MGRSIQAFVPMGRVPTVTHNDLRAYIGRDGRAHIAKSARLKMAEEAYLAALRPVAEGMAGPISGGVRARIRWCFPTLGRHAQGEARDKPPDIDNMAKTFLDCCQRAGIIADDGCIAELRAAKMWRDPSGVWFRFEEIDG